MTEACNIAAALPRMAAEAPDRIAMRCPGRDGRYDVAISYGELDRRSDAIAAGLQSGQPVAVYDETDQTLAEELEQLPDEMDEGHRLVQVQLGLICRQLAPLRTLVAHLQKGPAEPAQAPRTSDRAAALGASTRARFFMVRFIVHISFDARQGVLISTRY